MLSKTMTEALAACFLARLKYKSVPNQKNLYAWDEAWTRLMEVRYAPTTISDETWTGLVGREERLEPDAIPEGQVGLIRPKKPDLRLVS